MVECTIQLVAPLVGAWIEIKAFTGDFKTFLSLLSWERGLKYEKHKRIGLLYIVAPLVGAWIEIAYPVFLSPLLFVAPLVGAWIEIPLIT